MHASNHLLCKDVNPVVHLVSEGLNVAQTSVFCLENRLVCNVKVQKALLCQIVSSQFLALFLKDLCKSAHKLLSLMLVARQKIGETNNALLLVPNVLSHLTQVLLALLGKTAGTLVNFHCLINK